MKTKLQPHRDSLAIVLAVATAILMLSAGAAVQAQQSTEGGFVGQYLVGKLPHSRDQAFTVLNPFNRPQLVCALIFEHDGSADTGAYENGQCNCIVLGPNGDTAGNDDDSRIENADFADETDFADGKTHGEMIAVPTTGTPGRFDWSGRSALGVQAYGQKNGPWLALEPSIFRPTSAGVSCLCSELDDLGLPSTLLSQARVNC